LKLAPVVLLLAAAVGGCVGGGPNPGAGPDAHRSVVLIVVDTLRADRLGVYGYDERPTSPHIDRWAEQGLVFEHAWATSSWTLPSFGSVLTGRLPSAHFAGVDVDAASGVPSGVEPGRSFATLNERLPTLPEVLGQQGFATGALVSNALLDPQFGLNRGFADYATYKTDNSNLRRAKEVVDMALDWIDGNEDRPFFLMVHFFDPHMHYDAPAPYRGRFADTEATGFELPVRDGESIALRAAAVGPTERDFISAAYDEEVAYVDAEIGRFLDGMSRRAALEDSLVVLTSDHGEELFDHDGFEHGHTMYDELLRVPMILWGPQVEPGRESMPVSLLDVMPTILDAAGVARPAGDAEDSARGDLPGLSLLDAARPTWPRRRALVAERQLWEPEMAAIVSWPFKAILDIDNDRAMLFDLAADPGERDDLAAARPDEMGGMLKELGDQLIEAQVHGVATGAEMDAELLRRLRTLGYIR